ncbi:MAG: hydroxymethylglutaryl-CoA lyase [Planctomycetota bacterium]
MNPPKTQSRIRVVEVGPRDGLQSQTRTLTLEQKEAWIRALAAAGLTRIEAGSFVSPKRVPAMADTAPLLQRLSDLKGVELSVLVPNEQGLEAALLSGARHVAVFTATTDSFCQRNVGVGREESLKHYEVICRRAQLEGLGLRGYISCVFDCPFEGAVDPQATLEVGKALVEMGCSELSLGDTLGTGDPRRSALLYAQAIAAFGPRRVAGHFHDTWGRGLASALAAYQVGVRIFDSSGGGLGGCPFAPGAGGNVATEDLVALFEAMEVSTGINPNLLHESSRILAGALGAPPPSRAFAAREAGLKKPTV